VFVALNRESGVLTYVNAGHNAPILYSSGSAACLEATGLPLGMFAGAQYEARTDIIRPGDTLILFTDGLTDSIAGKNPHDRLRHALTDNPGETIANLKALVDPKQNEDDVTILLVKRDRTGSSAGRDGII
jgi:sigma-B regulation protein RsbU (phosphoserine phosphatase)